MLLILHLHETTISFICPVNPQWFGNILCVYFFLLRDFPSVFENNFPDGNNQKVPEMSKYWVKIT